MNFKSLNICVDGFNLELPQGTGVKSYGITLIKALADLGANINVLCSRPITFSHPLLAEALFFDSGQGQNQSPSNQALLKSLVLNTSGVGLKARKLSLSPFVIKSENDYIFEKLASLGGEIFNRSQCFTIANQLKSKTKIDSHIKINKQIDIWHATFPLPMQVNSAKRVTTIHDLIPLRLPYTTLDNKKFFFNLIKDSLAHSDLIVTVSENTKEDILRSFKVNPDKIFVTYQPIPNAELAIDPDFSEITLGRHKLERKKYFLFVGAIEPKKNLGRLIQAYSRLDVDYPLVVVGKKGWLWKNEIGNLKALLGENYQRQIKFLNYVSRMELVHLYNSATALIFPSLYEGFGLPPLEAMYRQCPVITSNVSSLPEICGDAAIYVDPYSIDEIEKAILKLVSNVDLQEELIHLGSLRAQEFSMEQYLKRLQMAYELMF